MSGGLKVRIFLGALTLYAKVWHGLVNPLLAIVRKNKCHSPPIRVRSSYDKSCLILDNVGVKNYWRVFLMAWYKGCASDFQSDDVGSSPIAISGKL